MIEIDIQKQLHGASGTMKLSADFNIKEGEFIALMGESGSGKTTLLRILAGLESTEGNITVDGKSWNKISPQERDIGFIFQDYALFDNMTVEENLLFVNDNTTLASELLEMTELSTLKDRNVTGLSGGQKQRVALCRAMMTKPKLLLMDEPLSALDPTMRRKLQVEIKALHERFNMTTIMVSHDASAVFSLASSVLVLENGNIVSHGTLEEVLLKNDNAHKAEVLKLEVQATQTMATVCVAGELLEVEVNSDIQVGQNIDIALNPKHVKGKQI
jgi:molybdate transport system ATP-binding protein